MMIGCLSSHVSLLSFVYFFFFFILGAQIMVIIVPSLPTKERSLVMASILNLLKVSPAISLRVIFTVKDYTTKASRFLGDAKVQVCVNGVADGPMVNCFLRQRLSDGTVELNDGNGFDERYKGSEIPGLGDIGIDTASLSDIREKRIDKKCKGPFVADITADQNGKVHLKKLSMDKLASSKKELSGTASKLSSLATEGEDTGTFTNAAEQNEAALAELDD